MSRSNRVPTRPPPQPVPIYHTSVHERSPPCSPRSSLLLWSRPPSPTSQSASLIVRARQPRAARDTRLALPATLPSRRRSSTSRMRGTNREASEIGLIRASASSPSHPRPTLLLTIHSHPLLPLTSTRSCGENDPNGPSYDPVHGMYHLHYQVGLIHVLEWTIGTTQNANDQKRVAHPIPPPASLLPPPPTSSLTHV